MGRNRRNDPIIRANRQQRREILREVRQCRRALRNATNQLEDVRQTLEDFQEETGEEQVKRAELSLVECIQWVEKAVEELRVKYDRQDEEEG